MRIPHPIPYQGSKRRIADRILSYFPASFDRLVEPFAGSAAISIASAFYFKAGAFYLNDANVALIDLWDAIINRPEEIVRKYYELWQQEREGEEDHYMEVRQIFNRTQQPEYLLYLLARCVKAAVRYNSSGEFNQSHDRRRKGRHPVMMRDDILRVSELMRGRTLLSAREYTEVLDSVVDGDLVYMDPPYQGTGVNGGFRYYSEIDYENFLISLHDLNRRQVPYLLSYDGRTGDKSFGRALPSGLRLTHIEIDAGRSSQATLLQRNERTYEALYISESLAAKIDLEKITTRQSDGQISLGL